MIPLRVLVADDEPLAREMLGELLAETDNVEVVASCSNGEEALGQAAALQPDVLFLDIEMPAPSGLDVARSLAVAGGAQEVGVSPVTESRASWRPWIVFVTAYSEYATDAFDVEALDYLVKPYSLARLELALQRVRSRIAGRDGPMSGERTPARADGDSDRHLERLRVQAHGRTSWVGVDELLWIQSEDYYSRLHTEQSSHLVRLSLRYFEGELDPKRFVRTHRSAMVHLPMVDHVRQSAGGRRRLVLLGGQEVPVSRARWPAVSAALDDLQVG